MNDADLEERERFAEYARQRGDPRYRDILDRLYALWEGWNATYFDGKMIIPHIVLAEPSTPRIYGQCGTVSGWGGSNSITIRPSLYFGTHPICREKRFTAEGRFRFVADVLLHETVHQFHQEVTGHKDASYKGHGPNFRDVANRIGADLGLAVVRMAKRRGKLQHLPSCAQWPHCVRPDHYYETVSPNGDTTPL